MQKKIFVIVNPASAHGKTGKRWAGLKNQLEAGGLHFDYALTEGPGDGTGLCRDALQAGYNILVAVGGDGTLNEVVNGFFAVDEDIRKRAAVGLISMGTGGDFARTVKLPRNTREAVHRIARFQLRCLDVGLITFQGPGGETIKRYFSNIVDVGLGGFLVNRTRNHTKALGGKLYFLLSTLVSLVLYQNQALSVVIDDSYRWQGKAVTIVAGNGQYFGGGMRITPLASPDDGLLDFLFITDMHKAKLIANLHRVYKGKHLEISGVKLIRGKKIRIESPTGILFEMDGEQPGNTPVEIEVLPQMLNYII